MGSMGRMYLNVCCDWIGRPFHALVHLVSMWCIVVLLHILFTFSKNNIITAIWSQQSMGTNPYGIARDSQSYMHIANDSGLMDVDLKKITVNMDHVTESSLVLEMSPTVSWISTQQTSVVY